MSRKPQLYWLTEAAPSLELSPFSWDLLSSVPAAQPWLPSRSNSLPACGPGDQLAFSQCVCVGKACKGDTQKPYKIHKSMFSGLSLLLSQYYHKVSPCVAFVGRGRMHLG